MTGLPLESARWKVTGRRVEDIGGEEVSTRTTESIWANVRWKKMQNIIIRMEHAKG